MCINDFSFFLYIFFILLTSFNMVHDWYFGGKINLKTRPLPLYFLKVTTSIDAHTELSLKSSLMKAGSSRSYGRSLSGMIGIGIVTHILSLQVRR